MNVKDFINKFDFLKSDNKITNNTPPLLNKEIELPNTYINNLEYYIKKINDEGNKDKAINLIQQIIKTPNRTNGIIYEILVYNFLDSNNIPFERQIHIKANNCFKCNNEGYFADGQIICNSFDKIKNIVFEIKTFNFGIPRYNDLKNKLNEIINKKSKEKIYNDSEELYGDFYITLNGDADISSKEFEEIFLKHKEDIIKKLFQIKNKQESYYKLHYTLKSNNITITAKKKTNIDISIFESEPSRWAENNQYQLLNHSSQFCKNSPFIIICPYDFYLTNKLSHLKDDLYKAFEILCKRIFILHTKINNKYIEEFDTKAQKKITIARASKKLSGVLFLDIQDNKNHYLYLNQNADNLLHPFFINHFFRENKIKIEGLKMTIIKS